MCNPSLLEPQCPLCLEDRHGTICHVKSFDCWSVRSTPAGFWVINKLRRHVCHVTCDSRQVQRSAANLFECFDATLTVQSSVCGEATAMHSVSLAWGVTLNPLNLMD